MKKSKFKHLLDMMTRIGKRGSKLKRFHKVLDNPAGTKMYNRSLPTSKRGCDGTLRR